MSSCGNYGESFLFVRGWTREGWLILLGFAAVHPQVAVDFFPCNMVKY